MKSTPPASYGASSDVLWIILVVHWRPPLLKLFSTVYHVIPFYSKVKRSDQKITVKLAYFLLRKGQYCFLFRPIRRYWISKFLLASCLIVVDLGQQESCLIYFTSLKVLLSYSGQSGRIEESICRIFLKQFSAYSVLGYMQIQYALEKVDFLFEGKDVLNLWFGV